MDKIEKINKRKEKIGSRKTRKLKKYSDNFNIMFSFFLNSYRKNILSFCGTSVCVDFDINSDEAKYCFRKFENGQFKQKELISRHSNIFKAVIIGKKSWGLWKDQWTDGIVDWTFTRDEILNEFIKNNIKIPQSLLLEFDNLLEKKKMLRNEKYLKSLK